MNNVSTDPDSSSNGELQLLLKSVALWPCGLCFTLCCRGNHPRLFETIDLPFQISLGDGNICANAEGFQGLVPLLPHLSPLGVPYVGVCGVYSENP